MTAPVLVTGHQPVLLPWAGYWHKVLSADICLVNGKVEYSRSDYYNRVRLQGAWMTIPVVGNGLLDEVTIADDPRALAKICKQFEQGLLSRRQPYRDRLAEVWATLTTRMQPGARLVDLTQALLQDVAGMLGCGDTTFQVVKQPAGPDGDVMERISDRVARELPHLDPEGTVYLLGLAGAGYYRPVSGLPRVMIQERVRPVSEDTVLGLIAQEPDPTDVIQSCFRWRVA